MARHRDNEVGSTTTDRSRTQLAAEGQDNIVVGAVYREKNNSGGQEVIPYFVDFAAASVQFTPVASSREDRMRTSDFLNRFELLEGGSALAEATPAESQRKADARLKEGKTGTFNAQGEFVEAPETHRA